MSVIDLLILAAVVGAVIQGLRRGLIGQVGSIAAIVIALIGCRMFGGVLSGLFPESHPALADILSNAVVYVVLYLGVLFVARALKFAVHAVLLGPIDRLAGVVFAVAKWVVGLSVLLNAVFAIAPSAKPAESPATDAVTAVAPWLWGIYKAHKAADQQPTQTSENDRQA